MLSAFLRCVAAALAAVFISLPLPTAAADIVKISSPPLEERWFSILIDGEQVGYYSTKIRAVGSNDWYEIEESGSDTIKIMGYHQKKTYRRSYIFDNNLHLKSLEIQQIINGKTIKMSGFVIGTNLKLQQKFADGKQQVKTLKTKKKLIPGPLLNLVPLYKGSTAGTHHRVTTFDAEDQTIKDVNISVIGNDVTPDGAFAIRLTNDLLPFVSNDIWVDRQGNTLLESVRDGLVITRAEPPEKMAAFISGMALAKKDLIYDFSLVRPSPPLQKRPSELTGLWAAIDGYAEQIPLLSDGWHQVEREATGRLLFRTGTLRTGAAVAPAGQPDGALLQPSEGIESDAAEIIARAAELTAGLPDEQAKAKALIAWTAAWLEDSIEDGGSALKSLMSRKGNCQTHAKLYTALARAAGIPTRFVSGLVSQDGKGFLYHSWAESWLQGRWLAVDPTFNQVPADPTHLAFFEGNRLQDLTPLVGIIGKISLTILEER
ncbi:MAG: transglutaminase domain-containing protein [Geobacter sp.]|nr:transglutaminase domain-containing protein [Geobacter sp.]